LLIAQPNLTPASGRLAAEKKRQNNQIVGQPGILISFVVCERDFPKVNFSRVVFD
jgi:hypothetical protein